VVKFVSSQIIAKEIPPSNLSIIIHKKAFAAWISSKIISKFNSYIPTS
jgi:hypothetical protein